MEQYQAPVKAEDMQHMIAVHSNPPQSSKSSHKIALAFLQTNLAGNLDKHFHWRKNIFSKLVHVPQNISFIRKQKI